MQHKYPEFDDYFYEPENYATRFERFYDEFQHVDMDTVRRMIQWMQAAWQCAREEQDEKRISD